MWSILRHKLKDSIGDDKRLKGRGYDYSGGLNTRMHPTRIGEKQAETLTNWSLDNPGQLTKRKGSVQISDDMGLSSVLALHDYQRQGYTDVLIAFEDDNANDITNEGNHLEIKGDFTASQTDIGFVSAKESGLTPDDVVFVNVGENNWWRLHKDSGGSWATQDLGNISGTGSDSPPQSTVGGWYANRFWVLKNDLLYFSAAYSADYSTDFNTIADSFRIPVGKERGILPTRDKGMIVMGEQAIWTLFPSATPAATDRPEPLVTSHGVVSKKAWTQVGDEVFYFAQDGFRSLTRTVQDKMQQKTSYPLSYNLKDEYDSIDWNYASRIVVHYFDNKVFIVVPTSSSEFKTWVFYPAMGSFTVLDGWSARCMTNHKISGELRMYYGLHGDGLVYRGWYGYTDEGTSTINGTAVSTVLETRQSFLGQPLIEKKGGEIEVETFSTGGDYSVTVKASVDGQAYSILGTISLASGNAPTLSVSLPFQLADNYVIRGKFHLDSLEGWRTIQIKIEESNSNSEEIKLYGLNAVAFPQEYQNE